MSVPLRFRMVVFSLGAALLVACGRDGGDDLVSPRGSQLSEVSTPSCESQIIPDEECNGSGREYIPYSEVESEGDAIGDIVADSYAMDYAMSGVCPRYLSREGSSMIDWTDPHTRSPYRFTSRGIWTLNGAESQIFLPSGQAIYNWPALPGGWPGVNLDTGESVRVTIRSGRGICGPDNKVNIIRLYGVRITDDDTRASSTGGSGGGSGGEEDNCTTEYVVVEVSYDDGVTWQTVWEGYATVCS